MNMKTVTKGIDVRDSAEFIILFRSMNIIGIKNCQFIFTVSSAPCPDFFLCILAKFVLNEIRRLQSSMLASKRSETSCHVMSFGNLYSAEEISHKIGRSSIALISFNVSASDHCRSTFFLYDFCLFDRTFFFFAAAAGVYSSSD